MSEQHAKLSPSAAHRWLSCTASALVQTPSPPSLHAARGTFLHRIREVCLRGGVDARDFVGSEADQDGFRFTFEDEDAVAMQPGIDHLRALAGVLLVEVKVDLDAVVPGVWGTCDAVVVDAGAGVLVVNDYKSGSKDVAPDSPQLRLYAIGALLALDAQERSAIRTVRLEIDQPGCGGLKSAEVTVPELRAFATTAAEVAREIAAGRVRFSPSESACRWCSYAPQCAALAQHSLESMSMNFDDLTVLPPAAPITAEQRSRILSLRPQIEAFLEALHASAMDDAMNGRPVPGFKLVAGRQGNRAWTDEQEALRELTARLGEKASVQKIISPAQAEKLLPRGERDFLETITSRAPGRPALVPEDDKRPAYDPALVFDAI